MKQKYIYTDKYESETERLKAFKNAIRKEQPTAILVLKADTNCRYCCETSIGDIFFEIKTVEALKFNMLLFEPAESLLKNIML